MSDTAADFFKLRFKDKDGKSLINIVEEPFVVSTQGFYLEPGSPYAERFNSILLRLMAFGVFKKWNTNFVPIRNNQLLPVVLTILLVGYMISGIIFKIEIALVKIKKLTSHRTTCEESDFRLSSGLQAQPEIPEPVPAPSRAI